MRSRQTPHNTFIQKISTIHKVKIVENKDKFKEKEKEKISIWVVLIKRV